MDAHARTTERGWDHRSRRWPSRSATGVLLGLAVQTIIPAVIDAGSIGLAALVLVKQRVPDVHRRTTLRRATFLGALGGFLSAPLWYLVTGSFRSFWASWWTYASFQNSAIGLSIPQEVAKGWHVGYGYYQHRPLLFMLIARLHRVYRRGMERARHQDTDCARRTARMVGRRLVPARHRRALLRPLFLGHRRAVRNDRSRQRGARVGRGLEVAPGPPNRSGMAVDRARARVLLVGRHRPQVRRCGFDHQRVHERVTRRRTPQRESVADAPFDSKRARSRIEGSGSTPALRRQSVRLRRLPAHPRDALPTALLPRWFDLSREEQPEVHPRGNETLVRARHASVEYRGIRRNARRRLSDRRPIRQGSLHHGLQGQRRHRASAQRHCQVGSPRCRANSVDRARGTGFGPRLERRRELRHVYARNPPTRAGPADTRAVGVHAHRRCH